MTNGLNHIPKSFLFSKGRHISARRSGQTPAPFKTKRKPKQQRHGGHNRSPDGKQALLTVLEPDSAQNRESTEQPIRSTPGVLLTGGPRCASVCVV